MPATACGLAGAPEDPLDSSDAPDLRLKLDLCLSLLLELFATPELAVALREDLLDAFVRLVLPSVGAAHIQFLLFYFAKLDAVRRSAFTLGT